MPHGDIFTAYKDYGERLAKFIHKRVQIFEDAEDIFQEVMYQYIRMDSLSRSVEQTAAWLYRVARNMIINHWSRNKEAPLPEYFDEDIEQYIFTEIADTLFGETITPETENLRKLIVAEIQSALEELPAEQRTVFELSELKGRTVKEIAKQTKVSVNTVLSRKHYAVKRLRKRLKSLYADITGE